MYVVVGQGNKIYARTHSPEKAGTLLCMVAQKEMTNPTSFHVEGPMECPTCGHGKPEKQEEPKEAIVLAQSLTLPAAIEMLPATSYLMFQSVMPPEPKESLTLPAAIEMLNNAVLCMATRLNRDRNQVNLEDVIRQLKKLQALIEAKR